MTTTRRQVPWAEARPDQAGQNASCAVCERDVLDIGLMVGVIDGRLVPVCPACAEGVTGAVIMGLPPETLTIYADPSWEDTLTSRTSRQRLIDAARTYTGYDDVEVIVEVLSQAGTRTWNVGTAVESRNQLPWSDTSSWPSRYVTTAELWESSDWEG